MSITKILERSAPLRVNLDGDSSTELVVLLLLSLLVVVVVVVVLLLLPWVVLLWMGLGWMLGMAMVAIVAMLWSRDLEGVR